MNPSGYWLLTLKANEGWCRPIMLKCCNIDTNSDYVSLLCLVRFNFLSLHNSWMFWESLLIILAYSYYDRCWYIIQCIIHDHCYSYSFIICVLIALNNEVILETINWSWTLEICTVLSPFWSWQLIQNPLGGVIYHSKCYKHPPVNALRCMAVCTSDN